MTKDTVIVFEPFDKPSQVLIDAMLNVNIGDDPFFRIRLKPYPSYSVERLTDIYGGRISEETGQYLETPVPANSRALRILNETFYEMSDRTDHPKWDHLGIVIPTKRGAIPDFIKYVDRVDADDRQLKNPRYWKERFPNKIIVLAHDTKRGAKLPSKEAINRYDRIWVVHKNVLEKMTQKCPKCAQQMTYTHHLYCEACGHWDRNTYPIPREHPKCHGCGEKYSKVLDTHKLRCTNKDCNKTKSHARVKYIGPLTSDNLSGFDFIGEYMKAMPRK